MTSITFSKKELIKSIGKEMSDEFLSDRINMMGLVVDSIEEDNIICDVTPNRPDLLSQQGLTRALKSFLGIEIGLKKYDLKQSDYKVIIEESVKKVRPYTCCAVVKNLHFTDEKIKEIIDIQEKLHGTFGRNRKKIAIGIYPMEKISFPIYFVGKDPKKQKFIPLESDKEMDGLQILSQHPTGREYAHLLEGYDTFPYFIDAKGDVMSMPPIINSDLVGKIEMTTTDVFIECSGFDRRILSYALNMIVTSLSDMGGEIYGVEVDYYGDKKILPDLSTSNMSVDVNYINKIIGISVSAKEAGYLLEKMGFGIKSINGDKIDVIIPCYRSDVIHPVDFVEDAAISYGFENLEPLIPEIATVGQENKFEIFKSKLAEILIGFGLLEAKSFQLINKEDATLKMLKDYGDIVEIANSVTIEYNLLRHDILPSTLLTLRLNKHHEYPQTFFEIGDVFLRDVSRENKVLEKSNLCVMLCGTNITFTNAKQILDGLFLGTDMKYSLEISFDSSFIPGRCGKVIVEGICIGIIGEIHPGVLYNFEVFMPASAFEINLDSVYELFLKK